MQTGTGSAGRGGVAQAIDELDLGALGRALWRRKRLIIGLTLLAGGDRLRRRQLRHAALQVGSAGADRDPRKHLPAAGGRTHRPSASATVDQEAVTSQVQLILSRGLALDVIRKLKLGEKPEFDPVLRGPSAIRTVLGLRRARQGSDEPDARGARAQELHGSAGRVPGGQVARHRDRIRVAGSGARRAGREHHRRQLSGAAAGRAAGADARCRRSFSPARSKSCARASPTPRRRSSNIAPRPI